MSKYIKVSSLGPPMCSLEGGLHPHQVTDRMISRLRNEVDQVLPDRPDMIVLPEYSDGVVNYSIEDSKDYYRERGNKIQNFLAAVAMDNNCYISYSAIREAENGTWRNSTVIIDRKGMVAGVYNKNHALVEETAQWGILCGKEAPIIECDFGRVACAICFDLNFDELRQKYVKIKPDLILFSSVFHGGFMQRYWAYSCRSHFIGCVAGCPNTVISPIGEIIAASTNYYKYVTAEINLDCKVAHLDYNWEKFKNMKVKYGSKVKITDPGYLGSVLISSETDEFSITDAVREFEIELLDDYLERALEHRHHCENMEP